MQLLAKRGASDRPVSTDCVEKPPKWQLPEKRLWRSVDKGVPLTACEIVGRPAIPINVYKAFAILVVLDVIDDVVTLEHSPRGALDNASICNPIINLLTESDMNTVLMIFGFALIMFAFGILGHDCQVWFERGVWSSTSISGVLELLQVDNDFMDQLRRIDFIHSVLKLPFYWVSIGVGYAAFTFGSIFD